MSHCIYGHADAVRRVVNKCVPNHRHEMAIVYFLFLSIFFAGDNLSGLKSLINHPFSNSLGIATKLRAGPPDNERSISSRDKDFSVLHSTQTGSGAPCQSLFWLVLGALSP